MCENCLKAPTNLQSMQSKVSKIDSFQTFGESILQALKTKVDPEDSKLTWCQKLELRYQPDLDRFY